MQVHVSAGPEDQAKNLDTVTLAFFSDLPVRWMLPEAAQKGDALPLPDAS